jgi:hypothetical protein
MPISVLRVAKNARVWRDAFASGEIPGKVTLEID